MKKKFWSNLEEAIEYVPTALKELESDIFIRTMKNGYGGEEDTMYCICTPKELYPFSTEIGEWIVHKYEIPFNFKFTSEKNAILAGWDFEDRLNEFTDKNVVIDHYYIDGYYQLKEVR